jgi:uncharacterized protein (UPF0332 family)
VIQRYGIVESTYNETVIQSTNGEKKDHGYSGLEDAITKLYSSILFYQAQALLYLSHKDRRLWNDIFNPEKWTRYIDEIRTNENECDKLLKSLEQRLQGKVYEKLEKQSEEIEKIRKDVRGSFEQLLSKIEVTLFRLLAN